MPLDNTTGNGSSIINNLGPMVYADTGAPYPFSGYSVTFGDPMIYTGTDGRRIVQLGSYTNPTRLKGLELPLATVKKWLKVEHDLEDDLITKLIAGAKDTAGGYLGRDFATGDVPASVEIDVLNIIAYRFENRGDEIDTLLPPIALPGLKQYRLLPGL